MPSFVPVVFAVQQSKGSCRGSAGIGGQLDEIAENLLRFSVQYLKVSDFLVPRLFVGCGEFRAVVWHWSEFRNGAVSRHASSLARENKDSYRARSYASRVVRKPCWVAAKEVL